MRVVTITLATAASSLVSEMQRMAISQGGVYGQTITWPIISNCSVVLGIGTY